MHVCTHTHIYIYIYINTYDKNSYIYTQTVYNDLCMHVCTYTYLCVHPYESHMHVCRVYIYTYIYIYIHKEMYIHLCTHIFHIFYITYACTHTHTCTPTYALRWETSKLQETSAKTCSSANKNITTGEAQKGAPKQKHGTKNEMTGGVWR